MLNQCKLQKHVFIIISQYHKSTSSMEEGKSRRNKENYVLTNGRIERENECLTVCMCNGSEWQQQNRVKFVREKKTLKLMKIFLVTWLEFFPQENCGCSLKMLCNCKWVLVSFVKFA